MQREDLVLGQTSPALLERGRRSQRLVLKLLLLEQPAQQNHFACAIEDRSCVGLSDTQRLRI
ncbi:TPA: hypothetical protein ACXJGC_002856 [Burkholderia cenocepacia]